MYTVAVTEFQLVGAMHQAMAVATRGWQRTLAHALSGGPDQAKQDLLWQTLRSYIGMWGEQIDVHTPRIAELVVELDPLLTPDVWRACVRAALDTDAGRRGGGLPDTPLGAHLGRLLVPGSA